MATESEIIEKIKGLKEKNSPDFKKYMDFYKQKFPEFYNSKLKMLEVIENNPESFVIEQKNKDNKGKILENSPEEDVLIDEKLLSSQPVFNLNEGKRESVGLTIEENGSASKTAPKKDNKKIILIVTLVLIIIGAAVGAYFLLI